MTLSQLNDTNAVQKWSFSKCGFSTGLVSKINGKHVHGNIIVLFIQKIAWGASCRPPGVGPKRDHVLHGRDQVWPGRRDWPRRPVHQNRRGTGSTPSSRSPADQVGRDQSRLPGSLVNGTTGLDTWSRWISPVMAGVDYLVPLTFLGRDTGLTPFP